MADNKQDKEENKKSGDGGITQIHHRNPGAHRGDYNAWQYASKEEADRAEQVRKGKPVTGW